MINKDEKQALEYLTLIQSKVMYEWNLSANKTEFIGAIHVLQHFIIMHMLNRKAPMEFNSWYTQND